MITINCNFCKAEFKTAAKNRKFCSYKCYLQSTKAYFSQEHLDYLRTRIGGLPPQLLIIDFISKYPNFKKKQVQTRITKLAKELGRTSKASKNIFARADLARTLGITLSRVRSWSRHHRLHLICAESNDRWYIAKRDFEQFAIANPSLLQGINLAKLRKVTSNKKVLEALSKTCKTPHFRDIVFVRLDKPGIYKSAKQAASQLNSVITDKAILYNCSVEKPMCNGMNWYKLKYPCFEVPSEIKTEFLFYAGEAFYLLYLELKLIDGYTKSCLVVAARNAINVALYVFKKRSREELFDQPLTPKAAIAQQLQERILAGIKKFYGVQESQNFNFVKMRLTNLVYSIFASRVGDKAKVSVYAEEFALNYIGKQSKYFFKSFIPVDYCPRNSLEKADFFGSIYALSLYARIYYSTGKTTLLAFIHAHQFISENGLDRPTCRYTGDFITHNSSTSDDGFDVEELFNAIALLDIPASDIVLCQKYLKIFLDEDLKAAEALGITAEKERYLLDLMAQAIK